MTEALLEMLSVMPALKILHLGSIQVTSPQLEKLRRGSGSRLEELTFHSIDLHAASLSIIAQCPNLKALGMAACNGVRLSVFSIGEIGEKRSRSLFYRFMELVTKYTAAD